MTADNRSVFDLLLGRPAPLVPVDPAELAATRAELGYQRALGGGASLRMTGPQGLDAMGGYQAEALPAFGQQGPADQARTLALLDQGGAASQLAAGLAGGLPASIGQNADQQAAAAAAADTARTQAAQDRFFAVRKAALGLAKDEAELAKIYAELDNMNRLQPLAAGELMEINAQTEALNAVNFLERAVEQYGILGPVDILANPQVAGRMQLLESFDMVNIFKTLANDTRLSDEDREFYASLGSGGYFSNLFTGSEVKLAKLREVKRRLEKVYLLNTARLNDRIDQDPSLMLALRLQDWGDIGEPVTQGDLGPGPSSTQPGEVAPGFDPAMPGSMF